jgi:hypothetical protein
VITVPEKPPRRRPRRAVGPAGSRPAEEPALGLETEPPSAPPADDAERYRREQPPHHDRGV